MPLSSTAGPVFSLPSVRTYGNISVATEGTGPDIVLVPGLASSRDVWAGLASRLRRHYRLHLIQVAGFAGSPAIPGQNTQVAASAAEAIADYIQHQHIRMPVIIGHSLGGEVALMLGARHPKLISRLIIVDALPFYALLLDPAATSETARPRATAFRAALLATPDAQMEASQTATIARLAKTEAVRPALVRASLASDRKTVADAIYELMTTDLRPELSHITVPVDVVYAYDPLYGVPASQIDALFHTAYATSPQARFRRIDGSFHFIMLDQPENFSQAVEGFLEADRSEKSSPP
ncbi:alpha/beta hydrolase [Gluconobacter sp. LMG 31484]|uniref:Alpha/beta hydrolase n=1 Tax=Gluconobacter vitians TaxID=2728102 RepID=A0ABR9Y1Z1_9PROT|nr:alpha/beta hydrolase [Gluconobacter vitians]MBF0857756.1 alpha/beta hydrolase [Gluconobacter vitians]